MAKLRDMRVGALFRRGVENLLLALFPEIVTAPAKWLYGR